MMKNKLSESSLTELAEKKKQLKGAAIGLGIVMGIAICILFYLTLKSKNYVLIAIIPACLLMFLPILINLGQLNTEIKSRQSK